MVVRLHSPTTSVRLKVISREDDGSLRCWACLHEDAIYVRADFELPTDFTVYGAEWVGFDPLGLWISQPEQVVPVATNASFGKNIVEVYAGTGAMGTGPIYMGGEIIAALDHNPLACQHLRLNAHGTVFEADVRDQKALQEIHRLLANEGTTLMGIYSRQGQQKAMADSRAHTLEDILQAADLWNVQAVILECVPGIRHGKAGQLCTTQRLAPMSTDPGPRGPMANLTQKVVVHHDFAEHPA